MGAVPLGSSMVASMASLHPKQKPTLAPRHVPRPSGAQSDSIFPRAGWGVSFFLVGGKETYSGEWKFHSKVDGLIFCWFGEWLLQKTPLLVGELDFVYQLVSFRRSEMRCWDCWDVFLLKILILRVWHATTKFLPISINIYWKMTTRIMFPRVSRHNCISTACCGARAASTCCRNATWSQLFPKNIRAPCRSAYVISYVKLVHI